MKNLSIIRGEEYKQLQTLKLDGKILDVGGSVNSGYQELIKGDNSFFSINIEELNQNDKIVDIEKPFPLEDNSFDHAICLNVLEHIFEINNAFSEQVRCVKSGGTLVFATPFMHHVHGSPDDYLRYTDSAYRRLAAKHNCEVVSITPLGSGFFSLGFQCVEGGIPAGIIRQGCKNMAIFLDYFFNKISAKYKTISSRIPLGYFVIMKKK